MNLTFETLTKGHAQEAARLALADYDRERVCAPDLPELTEADFLRNLIPLLEGDNGVAALEDGRLMGFLTGEGPFVPPYGPMQGAFSPIHAHAFGGGDRGRLASHLYAQAAQRWMDRGISGHAIALYAHDREVLTSFFYNGFGGRTADGIMRLSGADASRSAGDDAADGMDGLRFAPFEDPALVYPLEALLTRHMGASPCYMAPRLEPLEAYVARRRAQGMRYYGAFDGTRLVGFCSACGQGETLVHDVPGYTHLCGTYMLPAYRGGGRMAALLRRVIHWERALGAVYLGVDYESLNPTAQHFWPKHFAPYTCGVVRRQDERML